MFGSLSGERRTVGADFLIYNNTGIPVRLAMGEDTHTHTHLNGKHSCWGAKAHLDHMNSQGRTEIKVWIALHASNWATCNTHSHVTACHVYFSSFSANVKLILDFLNRLILFFSLCSDCQTDIVTNVPSCIARLLSRFYPPRLFPHSLQGGICIWQTQLEVKS